MADTGSVTNVIFDLGAVLLEWNPQGILEGFTRDPQERAMLEREVFRHTDWLEMDKGSLAEAGFIPRVSARTGLPSSRVEQLLSMTKDSLLPIPEGLELLTDAKSLGLSLYCLSNMSVETYASVHSRNHFLDAFSGIVISGQVKVMKPNPAVFELILDRYDLNPRNTLFIDDSADNVSSARDLGIRSILFEPTSECLADVRNLLSGA